MSTGDGSIEGRDLDGKIEADSGDGHITLDGRFDTLNIRTGDGSINAHALPGSKVLSAWNIHTGDGSVDLTVPSDLNANIDASTNDGRISLGIPVTVEGQFSNSKIHGKMNGGGEQLTIHTGDGSIRLVPDPQAASDETIDRDQIVPPLWVRAPVPGDRFQPLGMGGKSTPLIGRRVLRAARPHLGYTQPSRRFGCLLSHCGLSPTMPG